MHKFLSYSKNLRNFAGGFYWKNGQNPVKTHWKNGQNNHLNMLNRHIDSIIERHFATTNKALLLTGARACEQTRNQ